MRSAIADKIMASMPEDVKIFTRLYADIVLRVNQLLKERDLSQRDLAKQLDKSPSEISKWLNGDHNFTLRSIAKLEAELGDTILYVPKKKEFANSETGRTVTFTVHRRTFDKALLNDGFTPVEQFNSEPVYRHVS